MERTIDMHAQNQSTNVRNNAAEVNLTTQSHRHQLERNQNSTINERQYQSEVRIIKIEEQEVRQMVDQAKEQKQSDFVTREGDGHRSNGRSKGNPKPRSIRRFMRQFRYYMYQKQMQTIIDNIKKFNQMAEQNSSDDDQQNGQQDGQQSDQQGDQQIDMVHLGKKQKEISLCESVIGSFKHLLDIVWKHFPYLITTFLVSILVLILQTNIGIDQNCNLQELSQKKNRSLDNKCPLASYVLIEFKSIIIKYWRYLIMSLIVLNQNQIKQRKLSQYVVFFMTTLFILFGDCILQGVNHQRPLNEFVVTLIFIFIGLSILSKHSLGIVVYRFFQVAICFGLLNLGYQLSMLQRNNRSFLSSIVLQYFTIVMKKIIETILVGRLENNLYYDDVGIYYIFVVMAEYSFIFEYVLIQDNLQVQKVLSIINFVIIQVQNINSVNLFYKFYEYLEKKKMAIVGKMVAAQYIIAVILAFYQLMMIFVSELYIFIIIIMILKFLGRISKVDNEMAQQFQSQAIRANGYQDWKIDKTQINDFVCQQSLIAFLHFVVYQILLVVTRIVFPQNDSISKNYQMIYQIDYNTISLTNVLIFNIVLIVSIFGMIVIKKQKQKLKLIKQRYKLQVNVVWVIVSFGMMCVTDRRLFSQNEQLR